MAGPDITDVETGKSRILSRKCATCILNPADTRIQLAPERIRQFLQQAKDAESYVVCHSTLPGASDVAPAICRGFADAFDTTQLQFMRRLKWMIEVDPPMQGGN